MAEEKRRMPNGELDQLQTQRNALTGLLARFTADRDLLITTVQACEQRLQELGARFEATKAAATAAAAEQRAIEDLRQAITQLQQAQEQSAASARAATNETQNRAEQAFSHAEAALQRCEQLAQASQLAIKPQAIEELRQAIAHLQRAQEQSATEARAATSEAQNRAEAALQRCEQLAQTSPPAAAAPAPAVEPRAVEELRQAIAKLQQAQEQSATDAQAATSTAQSRAAQALSRAETTLQRCEQLTQTSAASGPKAKQLQSLNRTVERLTADREQLDAEIARLKIAVAQPQEALSQLVARVGTVESELIELRRLLERLRDATLSARSSTPQSESSAGRLAPVVEATTRPAPSPSPARWLWPVALGGVALVALAVVLMSSQPSPQRGTTSAPAPAQVPTAMPRVAAPAEVPAAPTAAPASLSVETRLNDAEVAVAPAPPPVADAAPSAAKEPGVPPALIALAPEGATACVLEPQQQRVCVYRRAGDAIVTDQCYPMVLPALETWPHWLVPSGLNAERIRLVDETNHRRLKIVPDGHASGPDVAHMSPNDFQALSRQAKPWITAWVVTTDNSAVAGGNPDAAELPAAVEAWRLAWEQRRLDDYLGQYSRAFEPQTDRDVAAWRAHKRSLFEKNGKLSIQLPASTIVLAGGEAAVSNFEQLYRAGTSATRSFKVLQWAREDGRWKIRAETVLEEGRQ